MPTAEPPAFDVAKQRSPAYPYISLELAVERTKLIYQNIKTTAQPREQIARAYNKPATSSATIQTIAALQQYGLLESVSFNGEKRLQITSWGRKISNPNLPEDERISTLQKAALRPSVFKEIWEHYGDTSGYSDGVVLFYLTHDREVLHGSTFPERGAMDVLRVYRATLAFAGINSSDNNAHFSEDASEWEAARPDSPVDEVKTSQVEEEQVAMPQPASPPQQRRIDMAPGEREIQTGMLSKTATFRVIVSGRIGVKEIETLIKKLELDKELLADDDETEHSAQER